MFPLLFFFFIAIFRFVSNSRGAAIVCGQRFSTGGSQPSFMSYCCFDWVAAVWVFSFFKDIYIYISILSIDGHLFSRTHNSIE